MNSEIVCKFNVPGLHFWPNPPEIYNYLGNLHRHIFFFEIYIRVGELNRQYEFIHLKSLLTELVLNSFHKATPQSKLGHLKNTVLFGGMSCEMIALELYTLIKNNYVYDISKIAVYEDNENGAILSYEN